MASPHDGLSRLGSEPGGSRRYHDQRRPAPRGGVRRAPPPGRSDLHQLRDRLGGDDPRPARRRRDLPGRGAARADRQRRRNCRTARPSSTTSPRLPSAPCWRRRSRCSSRCRSRSRWRSSSPTSRRRGWPSSLGYMVDLLAAIPSIVYGLWGIFFLGPAAVPVLRVARRKARLHPVLRGPGLGHRPHDAHRRHGPGHDDPADHHRRRPRGLLADAAQAPGGRAGARRHPLGDDPDTVLPFGNRRSSAARCSASAGRWARRWRWRSSSRSPAPHLQPDQPGEPLDDRRQHRPQLPESTGLAVNALIATGLVLFVITLVINFARARSSPARTSE